MKREKRKIMKSITNIIAVKIEPSKKKTTNKRGNIKAIRILFFKLIRCRFLIFIWDSFT